MPALYSGSSSNTAQMAARRLAGSNFSGRLVSLGDLPESDLCWSPRLFILLLEVGNLILFPKKDFAR